MRTLNILISGAALLAFTACKDASKTGDAHAEAKDTAKAVTEEAKPAEPPMDSAAMAKAYEAYMTPGEMHKMLASQDGKWSAEMSFWAAPDVSAGPPSVAELENKMIMGGRYQESNYKGTMMGMPFEGHGITAYDNAKKLFISTWIDNSGTGLMKMEGPYDEASKMIVMKGLMVDPSTGKDCEMRQEIKTIDAKHQVITMYAKKEGGSEFKTMEIKQTRK